MDPEMTSEVVSETANAIMTEAAPETFTQGLTNASEEFVQQTKNFWHIDEVTKLFTWGNLFKVIIAVVSILVFYLIYKLIKKLVNKSISTKFEKHTTVIVNKVISYIFYILLCMYVLSMFGVNLNAIWGAAGVAGLAIGFAAQTSVSNLISGLFVIGERALKIGDFIQVGDICGTVDNIGLLSVKIHTLDNQMIRIPNSTIINNNLMNYSSFPKRRFVFSVPVSYDSDMDKCLEVLAKVPERCPTVLQDPAPCVFFDGFEEGINMKLAVWFKSSDLIQTKNDVYSNIVKVCREYDVEIPYEHFDVKIIEDKPASKSAAKAKTAEVAKKTAKTIESKVVEVAGKAKAKAKKTTK